MQHGSLVTKKRSEGSDAWEFRWSENGPHGKRVNRKRVIGTVDEYPDADTARASAAALLHPRWFPRIPENSFGMCGGDDGARTRDLCRDRAAF
jgi:hypothetical protein